MPGSVRADRRQEPGDPPDLRASGLAGEPADPGVVRAVRARRVGGGGGGGSAARSIESLVGRPAVPRDVRRCKLRLDRIPSAGDRRSPYILLMLCYSTRLLISPDNKNKLRESRHERHRARRGMG
jgi:hypothetical protein